MLGISFGSVQSIWKDSLNLVWVAAGFVLCPLSLGWKENCVGLCQDLPEILEWDPEFFLKTITSVIPGWIGIIQKPSSSCLCGRAHHFHAQRTHDVAWMWSVLSCELCICSTRTNCKPQSLCKLVGSETDLDIGVQILVFPPWQCTFPPSFGSA
jgi:hypothetical protein